MNDNNFKSQIFFYLWKDFIASNSKKEDTAYGEMISFEKYFEDWDHDAILLERWSWRRSDHYTDEPYVNIERLGVYTSINTVARALQHLFNDTLRDYGFKHDTKFHVNFSGGDKLMFTLYENDEFTDSIDFVLTYINMDQRHSQEGHEGIKFDLPKNNNFKC